MIITKVHVLAWLENQKDKWEGKYVTAEEKNDHDKLWVANDKLEKIEELFYDIEKM